MANGGIIGPPNIPTSTTATGVWQQEEQYEAKVTDTWPQRALFTTKSARFNDGSNDYLSRTPSSAGSTTTGTFSFWVKRGVITSDMYLWTNFANGTNWSAVGINNVDQVYFYAESGGSAVANLKTNMLFRDVSAWYHIVVALDSTNGTADDRVKIYINGVQQTSFVQRTNPSSSADLGISETVPMEIGRYGGGSAYFDGYMSEVIFIDGQSLDPTSFGVANSDGVWTPIPYTGTFGTNGFNLQFENAAALGTDSSPNGNTFTVNNLTSIDQTTDYPVVNYATLNPLAIPTSAGANTFSNGNLEITNSADAFRTSFSTIGVNNGKWYWEAKFLSGEMKQYIGISKPQDTMDYLGQSANSYSYSGETARKYNNGSFSSYGSTASTGDIIMVAFNADNGAIWVGKNGTWFSSATQSEIEAGTTTNAMYSSITIDDFFVVGATVEDSNIQMNFGSPMYSISSGNTDGNGYGNFEYAVPSGYYALNTANLAEYG